MRLETHGLVMKTLCAFFITLFTVASVHSQKNSPPSIRRIDPTNWWVGMKNPDLQLLVYGPGAGTLDYSITFPGVTLVRTNKVENSLPNIHKMF